MNKDVNFMKLGSRKVIDYMKSPSIDNFNRCVFKKWYGYSINFMLCFSLLESCEFRCILRKWALIFENDQTTDFSCNGRHIGT